MSVASASLSSSPLQYVQSLLGAGNGTGSSATSSGGLDALFSSFTSLVSGGSAAGTATIPASGLNSTLLSTGTLSGLLSLQGLNGSAGTSSAAASSGGGTQSAGPETPSAASQHQGRHGYHHKSLTDTAAQLSTVSAPTTKATA